MNTMRFPILLVAVVSIACGTSGSQAARGSAALADTSAPAIPPGWPLLTDRLPDLDVSRVVTLPEDTFQIYRTDISLSFKPEVSDSAKVEFFVRHAMRVIGVTQSGRFFVRIPDPGTAERLLKVIAALRREPEIALAGWLARSALSESPPAHPPP